MALPFRVSWLCMLLWSCIGFSPQTGYNFARGYILHRSSQTSDQFTPGKSFYLNYVDQTNAKREPSFVSLQRRPVSFKNGQNFHPVRSFSEDRVQSQPGFVHKAKKFSARHSDNSKNLWSRQGDNHQMPVRHHYLNNAADSTTNLLSSSLHGNQVFSLKSAIHTNNHVATPQLVSNDIAEVVFPSGDNDIFIEQNHVQPSSKQPEQIQFPSGVFLGEGSFTGSKSGSLDEASNQPSQDLTYLSRKTSRPFTSKLKVQKPKYKYRKTDFSAGYQTPPDGSDNSDGLHKVTPSGFQSLQRPPSFNYFVPRIQMNIPKDAAKNKRKRPKSSDRFRYNFEKKLNGGCYTPTNKKSVSGGSVSNSKNLFPSRGNHALFRENVPNKSQQDLDKSNLVFNVEPSSSPRGSSRYLSSLGYQKVDADPENDDKSHFYDQNLASVLQLSNQYDGDAKTRYRGMDSTLNAIPALETRNQLNSVSAQDRFLILNGGYEDAMKAGLLKTLDQPNDFQTFSASIAKEPTNFASWPSDLVSEPKSSDSNCVVWKNTKSSSPPKSEKSARSSVNSYIKFKNRSARATAFLSKTCYVPFKQALSEDPDLQRRLAITW